MPDLIVNFVKFQEILLELLPLASKYLGTGEKLNENISNVLIQIFKRLNENVSEILNDEQFWTNFKVILGDHQTILHHPEFNKGVCPSALILKQVCNLVIILNID